MAENGIDVNSGFFTAKVAAMQRNEGDSDAADLVMYQRMLPQFLIGGVPTDIASSAPLPVAEHGAGKQPVSAFLQSVTGGAKNLVANYLASPDTAKIEADATMRVDRVTIHVVNTGLGVSTMDPTKYAGLDLGTGLNLKLVQSATVDLTDGVNVESFLDWRRIGAQVNYLAHPSGLVATAELVLTGGVRLTSGQSIQVDLADNFSSLAQHYIMLRGWYE